VNILQEILRLRAIEHLGMLAQFVGNLIDNEAAPSASASYVFESKARFFLISRILNGIPERM